MSAVNIAAVSGGFPSSQTFTEVKVAETALAVADGADEIDIVINVGNFLAGNYEEMCQEIEELKQACKESHLKVILESGALKTASNIKKASLLSIYSGADFIKTSTGKTEPAATLEAAYVMCQAIKEYYEQTGTMIGFKPAGGISKRRREVLLRGQRGVGREMAHQRTFQNRCQPVGQQPAHRYLGHAYEILLSLRKNNVIKRGPENNLRPSLLS